MSYKDPKDPRALESRLKHYRSNKKVYRDRAVANREKLRLALQVAKDRPCMDCGIKYPYYVMDLDHRPGTIKLYNPSRLPNLGSMKKLEEEIAKCDVVCSNCHRQRTFDREA